MTNLRPTPAKSRLYGAIEIELVFLCLKAATSAGNGYPVPGYPFHYPLPGNPVNTRVPEYWPGLFITRLLSTQQCLYDSEFGAIYYVSDSFNANLHANCKYDRYSVGLAFCYTVDWHVDAVCRSGYYLLRHTQRQAVRSFIVWVASRTMVQGVRLLSSGSPDRMDYCNSLFISEGLMQPVQSAVPPPTPSHYWYSRSDHITAVLSWLQVRVHQRVDLRLRRSLIGRWLAFCHTSCRRCSWATSRSTASRTCVVSCDADIHHLRR